MNDRVETFQDVLTASSFRCSSLSYFGLAMGCHNKNSRISAPFSLGAWLLSFFAAFLVRKLFQVYLVAPLMMGSNSSEPVFPDNTDAEVLGVIS